MEAFSSLTLTISKIHLARAVAPSENVIDGIYGASDALYFSERKCVGNTLLRFPYNDPTRSEQIALPVQGPIFSVDASADHPGVLFGP